MIEPRDTSVSLRAAFLSDCQERTSQKSLPRSVKHGAATAETGCVHSPRVSTDVGLWASRRLAGVSGQGVTVRTCAQPAEAPGSPGLGRQLPVGPFVFCLFITTLRFPNVDIVI